MSLTVDLSPMYEERLAKDAARHGLTVREYARLLIERELDRCLNELSGRRIASGLPTHIGSMKEDAPVVGADGRKAPTARARYADSSRTVESFMREKREENEREEYRRGKHS